MIVRLILILVLPIAAAGAGAGLDALRNSLVGMRGKPADLGDKLRGASPQLTTAKHQLRDWIESHLSSFALQGDASELMRELNRELNSARLFCEYQPKTGQPPCPDSTNLGYLAPVDIRRSGIFLIVQTAVGIVCGYDESAYVYTWSSDRWTRAWQNEQNTYTEKAYAPQSLVAVRISPYTRTNEYLVLTLGSVSWCSSNWLGVFYRAFRIGPDPQAAPIVEGAPLSYNGVDPPIQGSISLNDVLVEYTVGSIDSGIHSRPAVRHYRIQQGAAKRVDPIALRPRDFVDEWLTSNWSEAVTWSEAANRPVLRDVHTKLHREYVHGEFISPTMHCADRPDLWQVGVDFGDAPPPVGTPPSAPAYFLVRWRPPYNFRLVQIGSRPFPGCTEEDRPADEEPGTLFPVHD